MKEVDDRVRKTLMNKLSERSTFILLATYIKVENISDHSQGVMVTDK